MLGSLSHFTDLHSGRARSSLSGSATAYATAAAAPPSLAAGEAAQPKPGAISYLLSTARAYATALDRLALVMWRIAGSASGAQ